MEVDKIHFLSDDKVIGFSGDTDICKHIVDVLQSENGSLSCDDIGEIIRRKKYELTKETGVIDDIEFILAQNTGREIKIWKLLNGVYTKQEPDKIQAIGLFHSVIPHFAVNTKTRSVGEVLQFGVDLIGWVSSIESFVGDPNNQGCNICYIDLENIRLTTERIVANKEPLKYRFSELEITQKATSLENTVQIGYISSTTSGLETSIPFLQEIIEPDLNAYASELGYNVNFKFVIDDAQGSATIHLEKVQGFKAMGIDIFIGGGWSSHAKVALSYCNDNDMLMFSPTSSSPLLAISNDNYFRLSPTDNVQVTAISKMLTSQGIKAIIILQRSDAWADGIYNYLEPHFKGEGGVIYEKIRYACEATEFSSYLQVAEIKAREAVSKYGAKHVGVQIISFDEFVTIITQAERYPTLYSLTWFGTDGSAMVQHACDNAPRQSSHLKVYSPVAAPAQSEKFTKLYDRYFALLNQPLGFYSACTYDIAWILAQSILGANSVKAHDIIPILPNIAKNYYGASGLTKLNEDGDRYGSNYQIWSYRKEGHITKPYVAGFYNMESDSIKWDL